ncbi:MAG TPA: glycosyltransferase family 9 protein [Acidobacteriaceae bacterium]|nr:glycosyltransferase family 9 protein [Acidobacteriaceae bacterium]
MSIQRRVKRTIHLSISFAIRLWASVALRVWGRRDRVTAGAPPQRILLINCAHIGDVVISTSLFPVLRSAYPRAEFGFLSGSWASMVVKDHPEIAFTHEIDHWRLNRVSLPFRKKFLRSWTTRRKALKEIRSLNYDMSLSLHSWFPDFICLTWLAHIPRRLGFRHSWFGPFATMLAELPQADFVRQGARVAEILSPLGIDARHLSKRHSMLAPSSDAAKQEVCDLLEIEALGRTQYIVIHIGSGEPSRELPVEFWRQVAQELSTNYTLLFTGRGVRDEQQIARVISGLPHCVSACNQLSWNGFVAAVRYGKYLYGVESMAGHVAAAVGTACSVVYTGTAGVARWRPDGIDCTVFTQHVPCAPCGLVKGCEHMTCLRAIKPASIIQK